ncbi:TadG family pilus assembly protein [Pseudonocardia oroxyli]|nr:TadG family pilus assembly protein [Pseudonocardia oroxyli]
MNERGGGAMSVPGTLLVLALLLAAGLGIDGVRKAQQLADADAIAEESARAGAQQIDINELRRGHLTLDTSRAVRAATRFAELAEATATAEVTPNGRVRVRVILVRPSFILGVLGVEALTSTGSAESAPLMIPSGGPR